MDTTVEWPKFYPEQCPPAVSQAVDMNLYRLVKADIPAQEDFIPHRLMYPKTNFDDMCDASGLSVCSSFKSAIVLKRLIPKFKKYRIAVGHITEMDGVVLGTPSKGVPDHFTWWVPIGVAAESLFSMWNEG